MKILVTNNHLAKLAGSETWTYTIVKELQRLGYNVDVFTFEKGKVSDKLKGLLVEKPKSKYDLILVNHNTCLREISNVEGYKIFTSHGYACEIEHPEGNVEKYVAVSDEIKEKFFDFNMEIIYNGVDCERFKKTKELNKKPKKVLALSKSFDAYNMIKNACEKAKIQMEHIKNIWDVEKYINDSDIVITLGRGALESMACGRFTIIYDYRPYMNKHLGDGAVTIENIDEIKKCNFSGRKKNIIFNSETLYEEIKKYNVDKAEEISKYVRKEFNIKKIVGEYLKLYEKK